MNHDSKIFEDIVPRLGRDDDPELWRTVILILTEEFERRVGANEHCAFLWMGVCSHWIRPHQSRWTAAGGFAWPMGYGDNAGIIGGGLPRFDWSMKFRFSLGTWEKAEEFSGKKKTVLRVAVPARTGRHQQAAIHTIWLMPENETVFWGFRKAGDDWRCVAVSDRKTEGDSIDPRFWSEPLRRSEYE